MEEQKAAMAHDDITPIPARHTPRDQTDGDHLRSEALSTDLDHIAPGYFKSARVIGTYVGIAFTLTATYFYFEASAAVLTFINADIGPSENSALFSIVWTVAQPISILLFGRLTDRFG